MTGQDWKKGAMSTSRPGDSRSQAKTTNKGWLRIFSLLEQSSWTHKGINSICPFCRTPSKDGDKPKFDIAIEKSKFKYFNCFHCGPVGPKTGVTGVRTLAQAIGERFSMSELIGMAGDHMLGTDAAAPLASTPTKDNVKALDWPPNWIENDQDHTEKCLAYLERRGITPAKKFVEHYDLCFSKVVEMEYARGEDDTYVQTIEYPCIVVPLYNIRQEIIGWTSRRVDDGGDPKARNMKGEDWKKEALLGYAQLDPNKPMVIVEGLFSALSTPNSIALNGKVIHSGHLSMLAACGKERGEARIYIFALDPTVARDSFKDAMNRLRLKTDAVVVSVDWGAAEGEFTADPNDRGRQAMRKIIEDTVKRALNKNHMIV